MKAFLSVGATAASLLTVNAAIYTQTNYITSENCQGQPIFMASMQNGICSIQGTSASQCTALGSGSAYNSMLQRCSSTPLNMTGIVQNYVAFYTFTSSNTCEGDPAQVEAWVADANCHPTSVDVKTGSATQWTLVNCNGGRPIRKTCSDSGCSNCQETQYNAGCNSMGSASAILAQCVNGKTGGGTGNGKGNGFYGDATNDAGKISAVSGIVAWVGALALLQ